MSQGNVFSIQTGQPTALAENGEPVVEIVELIERFLADARSGKIRAVAIVAADSNWATARCFAADTKVRIPSTYMIGIIEALKYQLIVDQGSGL